MSSGAFVESLHPGMQPHPPTDHRNANASAASQRRGRPAAAMPVRSENRRASSAVSLLLHIALIVLLVGPAAVHTGVVIERAQGSGGSGPAGGGGGGRNGTGGVKEHVQYVQVTPPPPPPTPVATPKVVKPPVIKTPEPKPVVPPPQVIPPPQPQQPEAKLEVKADVKAVEATAPLPGTGGGTGRDGSAGNGPGTGGGVGTGNGTGRGSGNGAGTGGGVQPNYSPTAIELFIPPLPVPGKVHGFHLIAEFDVDSTGKVLEWKFNSTGDRGYDRKLDDVLKSTKFRAGTTPDGKPIRMKAQIIYDF